MTLRFVVGYNFSSRFGLSLNVPLTLLEFKRRELLGQPSDRTGSTACYFGPLVHITLGRHFSANAGVDVPVSIDNRGFQSVPDFRLHGGISWRF